MMKNRNLNKVIFLFFLISFLINSNSSVAEELLIDARIKRVLYQEGAVINLTLGPDRQTVLQFEDEEEIEIISFGDSYGWDVKQIGSKFFIKFVSKNFDKIKFFI